MTDAPRHGRPWPEFLAYVAVLLVLGTIPFWSTGWWTALPFAVVLGGYPAGRWLRWFWGSVLGFAAGAITWVLQLADLPADPRTRLADVLGAAQGLSGTLFTLLGPLLFGLVALVAATALAGGVRLVVGARRPDSGFSGPGPAGTEPTR